MKAVLGIVFVICMPLLSFATQQLGWASYFGGTSDEYGFSVACDKSGNVYISGNATSSSHIASIGAYQATYGGIGDAFLAKFNSSGTLQWATYFGGGGIDQANSIACDTSGNVYITGYTNSTTGIATAQAYQATKGGSSTDRDAFLAKFSSSGNLLWATYFGGGSDDEAEGVSCDVYGNVYITGMTQSTSGIATSGSYQSSMGGAQDVFVAKFNGNGQIKWASYYGGTYAEKGDAIACDGAGNVFITGYTLSANGIATTGAYQTTEGSPNAKDAFLARFDSTGALQWGTYFGGTLLDEGFSVACDASGNVYMGGETANNGLSTSNSYQTSLAGSQDGYLAKFDSSGTIQWSTYYGGSGLDEINAVATDSSGNVFIGGSTQSSSGVTTAGCYQSSLSGGGDGYVAKFNALGQRQWGSYYGGNNGLDYVMSLSCDHMGAVFLTGYTASSSGIATVNSHQDSILTGGYSAFLAKFSADTSVKINQAFTDTALCTNTSFSLNYSVSNNFYAGNTFTVQLSDGSGDFSTPVTIGSISAVSSGTINCTIPATSTSGTAYRVRILASSPTNISDDDGFNISINTSAPASVTISSVPAIPVNGQPAVFTAIVTNGGTAPTYQWRVNGVNIAGATSNPYTNIFAFNDQISVFIHSNRTCTSPDTVVSNNETVSLGIDNISGASDNIAVFPNPNSGVFAIRGAVDNGNYSIEVFNVSGQMVYGKRLNIVNRLMETQIETAIPAGIYSLQIKGDKGNTYLKKIVINQ